VAPAGLAPRKKGARRTGRAIAFVDETGHTFRARVGTTWAPKGQPPVLKRLSQRREVSSVVALVAPLDGPPRLYARHFTGSIRGAQVIEALRAFRRRIGQPLLVLWDHLPAHQAKPVQAFVASHPQDYQLEWLPAYAPELNPEELCNGAVKQELLNALPPSVGELRQLVRRSFVRLGRQSERLHGFFHHAGLTVN
jgi:transposase